MITTKELTGSAERWREVQDWPYEVSGRGRVRRSNPASGTRPGLVLRPQCSDGIYLRVELQDGGNTKKFHVARLVGDAFVPGKTLERCFINHKDGDPKNNHASNLEWCTRSENQIHAFETGLQADGEGHGCAKLTADEVREIRRRYSAGETQTALAKEFGVVQTIVSRIVNRKIWARLNDIPWPQPQL